MLTDLTTDTNTANTAAPVVSSASYNFVAGDVGNWLYIKSGTNWTPGWYKIASVASNKATLSAAVGSSDVVQVTNQVTGQAQGNYGTNTVIGCATVGTPTAGTFTIDYSQATAARISGVTDFAAVGASTTLTSATAAFTPVMVGNFYHQTTTGTGGFGVVGWYEIVSYTNATTVVLDRTPNSGTASVACTGYVGGALSMNSTLDDDVMETAVAGQVWFVKNNGTFSLGETVSIGAAGSGTAIIMLEGYNTRRGDAPTGTSRPTINCATASFTLGARWHVANLIFTGTATTAPLVTATGGKAWNCKMVNSSTTAARPGFTIGTGTLVVSCEVISYRGAAVSVVNTAVTMVGCWIHDSVSGISGSSTQGPAYNFINNIFSGCTTAAITITVAYTGLLTIHGNTFYGAENKLGIGVNLTTGGSNLVQFINNIVYGFATGCTHADTQSQLFDDYNCYYNNTADVTSNDKWQKGLNDVSVDPAFTSVTQITGTGATSSTNVLTDGSKDFTALGVTTNDYVYLVSGSGTGFASAIFGISAVGTTTLTLTSNITTSGSGSSIVYQTTIGNNFLPTGAI